jgi:hypothetical protein
MNRAAPIVAMLWENWRLTRVEAGQRLALGIVAGSIVMTLSDNGATAAFWMIVTIHSMIWFSIAKLNGGRFADGYKPGFPFHLWYSKPLSTVTLVSVAILYDAITCTVLYLVSAAALGLAFGKSLPLSSMVLILVSYHFAYACCQWSTRNRLVQWIGSIAFSAPMFFMLFYNMKSPLAVEFSWIENSVFIAIAAVSFVLTVMGVARQRRGDSTTFEPRERAMSGGFPDWLVGAPRFRCPTSSATKAQAWFELRSSGLPVLMIGLIIALLLIAVYAVSIPIAQIRPIAIAATVFSVPIALFGLGSNAFGIRRKQGRTYVSAFEMTQPYDTGRAVAIKLMIRTACVLVALILIGVGTSISALIMGAWGEYTVLGNSEDLLPKLLTFREKVAGKVTGLSGLAQVASVVIAIIAAAAVVAWQASREALRARHPRLLFAVQWLPVVWALVLMLVVLAQRKGFAPDNLPRMFALGTFWVSGIAMALATAYLAWNAFAQRVLDTRYAVGVLAISAAFGLALWAGTPVTNFGGIVYLALGILLVGVLPPWALSRARHS